MSDLSKPEGVPVQDLDLLGRLNHYIEGLGGYLREGRGWLIFNADRQRAARISQYLLDGLAVRRPRVPYYFLPWRDFSMHAYMLQVMLNQENVSLLGGGTPPDARQLREFALANTIALDAARHMLDEDLLIISGVAPRQSHELSQLDSVIDDRVRRRQATVLISPLLPDQLSAEMRTIPSGDVYWPRIFAHMYETSLIAM